MAIDLAHGRDVGPISMACRTSTLSYMKSCESIRPYLKLDETPSPKPSFLLDTP